MGSTATDVVRNLYEDSRFCNFLMGLVTFLAFAVVLAAALKSCIAGDALIVAHNVTIEIICAAPTILPTWFVNGTVVGADGYSYRTITNGREVTTTLTINGNRTCDPLNMVCKVFTGGQLLSRHNTTLTFQGPLPPPENVDISEHFNSSIIEWEPPFSTMNNDTIIHVDPHITQYTVCITDIYTGNIIVKENVTETQYTFNIQDDGLCPMYQVSAWNSGGKGQPVQDSILQVPRSIAAENIVLTATSDALHIHVENMDVVCISRMPEFFLITMMTSTGNVLNETTRQHQPGEATADFNVNLSQFADVCSLHVRFSAGNSAGMSTPSETVQVVCPGGSIDSTTTTTSSATTASIANGGSESRGNGQPGVNTTSIVIIITGVIAATGGVLIVVVAVMIMCYRKFRKNSKVDHSDGTDNDYSKNPSLGGLYIPEADYITTEGTTSRPVARDPESTATKFSHSGGHQDPESTATKFSHSGGHQDPESTATKFSHSGGHLLLPSSRFPANRDRGRTQSSNSTESTDSASSSSSTGSGGSGDPLLRPSSPASAPSHTAPAKSPQPLYAKHAQLNVKQTQVPPPTNDDHVQYAEIEHQDKM